MSPNSDVNHRNLSYWLKEFGCMDGNPQGVLHVYTDDEVAVGAVFQDAKLDKPVKVTRAAPQSPETNGLAERCVRTLKETLVVLRMDLQTSGLDIQRTGAALHELVLYISHMSNLYVGVHGTTKTAREFLEGRKQQTPVTSSFGELFCANFQIRLESSGRLNFHVSWKVRIYILRLGQKLMNVSFQLTVNAKGFVLSPVNS